jgi:hypothetical protein
MIYLLLYIPLLISFIGIIVSGYVARKQRSHFNNITVYIVVCINAYSAYHIYGIIQGGWPSYWPHILLVISTILVCVQLLFFKKDTKN